MSTGAFTLTDIDKPTAQKGKFSLSDIDQPKSSYQAKYPEAQQVAAGLPGMPKPQLPVQDSYARQIATGQMPLLSMQPGLPSAYSVPQNAAAAQALSAPFMLGEQIATRGIAAIPTIGRSIAGAAVGSAAGGYGGQHIGQMFGAPKLGGQIGATLGGLAGGFTGGFNAPVAEEIDPVAAAVRNREAAWIPTRMAKVKPPVPVPPEPFPGATSSATPIGNAPLPAAGQPVAAPTFVNKFTAAKQVLNDNPDLAESPQDLINRMKKLVKPGEEPTAADLKRAGDLTQTPTAKLRALAKFGDKLAQNELNRRLK